MIISAIRQALPNNKGIYLEYNPELGDAKWVPVEEIREALRIRTSRLGKDPRLEYIEGRLRLPPKTAIAHQLLLAVVAGPFLGEASKI